MSRPCPARDRTATVIWRLSDLGDPSCPAPSCDRLGLVELFDEVGEALRSLVPPALGPVRTKHHRYGIKVWFGPDKPTRLHYEAQVIGAKHVPEATVLAIEVGFHAEHRDPAENERTLARLTSAERGWRKQLGPDAVAGAFIDDRHGWQRLSETWADPDLGDPDLAFELATRLTDYLTALEPVLRR